MAKEVINLRKKFAKQREELTALQNIIKKGADKYTCAHQMRSSQQVHEKQAEDLKKVIEKNIRFQMTYDRAIKEQLQGGGVEVQTSVPNVSPEVLKIMGIGSRERQTKYADAFFGGLITKVCDHHRIALKRELSVKYYMSTGELRINGRYACVSDLWQRQQLHRPSCQ